MTIIKTQRELLDDITRELEQEEAREICVNCAFWRRYASHPFSGTWHSGPCNLILISLRGRSYSGEGGYPEEARRLETDACEWFYHQSGTREGYKAMKARFFEKRRAEKRKAEEAAMVYSDIDDRLGEESDD